MKAGVLDMDHLKSMTEQAGAKVTTRGCGKAPVRSNPGYLVTLFSNHAAEIGPEPDGGKVRRVNVYRCRNIFRPVPRDGESAEGINLKDWIRKGNMSADFFHAAVPWYSVLQHYATNVMRSPHVAEDTRMCTTDGDEVEVESPASQFVLSKFSAVEARDAMPETDVKRTMKLHWPNLKLKDVVVRMAECGFVFSDSFVSSRGARFVKYNFVDGGRAQPVGKIAVTAVTAVTATGMASSSSSAI